MFTHTDTHIQNIDRHHVDCNPIRYLFTIYAFVLYFINLVCLKIYEQICSFYFSSTGHQVRIQSYCNWLTQYKYIVINK